MFRTWKGSMCVSLCFQMNIFGRTIRLTHSMHASNKLGEGTPTTSVWCPKLSQVVLLLSITASTGLIPAKAVALAATAGLPLLCEHPPFFGSPAVLVRTVEDDTKS